MEFVIVPPKNNITVFAYIKVPIVDSGKQESTKSAAELKITTWDLL